MLGESSCCAALLVSFASGQLCLRRRPSLLGLCVFYMDGLELDADAELPWWSRTYQGYQERFVRPYLLELTSELHLELKQAPCVSAEHAKEAKASADGSCTASTVWDAGIMLAAHVYHGNLGCERCNMRCLDLGSGTGIVGLGAAASGAFETVVLTDLPSVLPLLRQNTECNAAALSSSGSHRGSGSNSTAAAPSACRVVSHALAWDDRAQLDEVLAEHGPFDLIAGGDLLYRPQVVQPLLTALEALVGKRTTVLLAASLQHSPETIRLFVRAAREAGFEVERIDQSDRLAAPEAFASPEVRVLQLRRARKRAAKKKKRLRTDE